jgi:hypothetical protein
VLDGDAESLPNHRRDLDLAIDRRRHRVVVEDLRAEVHVEAGELEMLARDDAPNGVGHALTPDRYAELGIDDACADLGVSMHIDARIQPYSDRYLRPDPAGASVYAGRNGIEQRNLIVVVDDNRADALLNREVKLGCSLVVAVEDHLARVDAGLQPAPDLAAGDDIEANPVLLEYPHNGRGEVGLAAVNHTGAVVAVPEGAHDSLRAVAQCELVEDVERGAIFGGQVGRRDSAHGKLSALGADRRIGPKHSWSSRVFVRNPGISPGRP